MPRVAPAVSRNPENLLCLPDVCMVNWGYCLEFPVKTSLALLQPFVILITKDQYRFDLYQQLSDTAEKTG